MDNGEIATPGILEWVEEKMEVLHQGDEAEAGTEPTFLDSPSYCQRRRASCFFLPLMSISFLFIPHCG